MEIRNLNTDQKIILNQDLNFRTDLGWADSFQSFEDEILESIINPVENYETMRFIHKPYVSEETSISQTDIWYYFYFASGSTHSNGLNYGLTDLIQTNVLVASVKNSFFRLDFFKTRNDELPNRSNRKFVFAKHLTVPLGEKIFLTGDGYEVFIPVFTGSNYRNKENMYLFWFYDDTVLEETDFISDTFFFTARFFNAYDASIVDFATSTTVSKNINESTDMYYKLVIERESGTPSYNYTITDVQTGERVGTTTNPIKFYEIISG